MSEWSVTSIFPNQWKASIKSQVELDVISCLPEVYCIMEWMTVGEWFYHLSPVDFSFESFFLNLASKFE